MKNLLAFIRHYRHLITVVLVAAALVGLGILFRYLSQPRNHLELVAVSPSTSTISSIFSVERITFSFNLPLNPQSISVTSSPFAKTKIDFDPQTPTQFAVFPLEGWDDRQTYTLTVSPLLGASTGERLDSPVTHTFTRIAPANFPQADESDFDPYSIPKPIPTDIPLP